MDEDEEVEVRMEPFSRRMGWLDIPICFLGLAHNIMDAGATLFADLMMVTSGHANYLRDEREFRGIVKNYDHTYSIGSGCSEPEDGHRSDSEDC